MTEKTVKVDDLPLWLVILGLIFLLSLLFLFGAFAFWLLFRVLSGVLGVRMLAFHEAFDLAVAFIILRLIWKVI